MSKTISFKTTLISIVVFILMITAAIMQIHPNDLVHWLGDQVTTVGVVSERVLISGGDVKVMGQVLANLKPQKVIGQIGSSSCWLDSSFAILKSAIYQAITQIPRYITSVYMRIGHWGDMVYQSKSHLEAILESFLTQTRASLLFSMVFGGDADLTSELDHWFKVTGMLHVVSASGYNVGLVRGISQSIYGRFWWRTTASFFTLGTIFLYLYLADMTPSVIRAGIMISLQLLASTVFLRQYHVLWLLGLTAGLMLLWNPLYLENLSFQFSILACFGILIWGTVLNRPSMYELSSGQTLFPSLSRALVEAFWLTWAAQSFSWGIQITVFNEISLVSLVANPAAIWLTPWLTMGCLVFLALAVPLVELPVIGELVLPLVAVPLVASATLFLEIISFFGQWEWGVLAFPTQPRWFPYIWWLGILSLVFVIKKIHLRAEAKYYVV